MNTDTPLFDQMIKHAALQMQKDIDKEIFEAIAAHVEIHGQIVQPKQSVINIQESEKGLHIQCDGFEFLVPKKIACAIKDFYCNTLEKEPVNVEND